MFSINHWKVESQKQKEKLKSLHHIQQKAPRKLTDTILQKH